MEPYQAKGLNRTSKNLTVWRDVVDGQNAVRVKFGSFSFAVIFLVLWLAGWSVGCMKLINELTTKPFEWGLLLHALPFVGVWIFVVSLVLFMVLGRTVVTFFRGGGTVFRGIGSIGWTKKFVISPIAKVKNGKKEVHRGRGGTMIYHTLLVDSPSDPCSPREIYADTDAGVVMILRDIAVDVCQCSAASEQADAGAAQDGSEARERDSAEAEAEQETKDRLLLSGAPPKRLTVTRDMEGRIVANCRSASLPSVVIHLAVTAGIASLIYATLAGGLSFGRIPLPVVVVASIVALIATVSLLNTLFGRRRLVIDHGRGETFTGIACFGKRKRFMCGYGSQIALEDSEVVINGARMQTISIKQPDGETSRICTTWPNDVKPYLAAVLRHPESVVVAPTF